MKIFVIHYDKLVERKIHMLSQLQKYDLDCEFVSNFGKDVLTEKDKARFRGLNDAEISISLHHFECYKRIAENYDYAIIFEDDVILGDNFKNTIEKYINDLPNDWDMLFFGAGPDQFDFHIPKFRLVDGVNVYKKCTLLNNKQGGINGSSRFGDSYVISKKCCQKILENINLPRYIISHPVDHLLNYINFYNNFNVYWAEPTITIQGSGNGTFKSSIR
jgi:hypothetical protein